MYVRSPIMTTYARSPTAKKSLQVGKCAQKVKIGEQFRLLASLRSASFSKFRRLASLKFWVAKFRRVVSAS